MKTPLALLGLLILQLSSFAQVHRSVANGNWSDPNTWDTGVPATQSDSIIVSHQVTANIQLDFWANRLIVEASGVLQFNATAGLHGNLVVMGTLMADEFGVGDGDFSVNDGIIQADVYGTSNDSYLNNGTITCTSDFAVSEDIFENTGMVESAGSISLSGDEVVNFGDMIAANILTDTKLTNYDFISTSSNLLPTDEVTNMAGAVINCGNQFIPEELVLNDGDINCGNLTVNEYITVTGAGRICITDCFINLGDILGTLDICDASTSFCDLQLGTVAASVTFCSAGPCQTVLGVETPEVTDAPSFELWPNPAKSQVNIHLDESMRDPFLVEVFDLNGREISSLQANSDQVSIDISTLESGMYILVVQNNSTHMTSPLIVE